MEYPLKLGLISTATEFLYSTKSKKDLLKLKKKIQTLDVELVDYKEPLINRNISKKASRFYYDNRVDILLVLVGTWTYDNFIVDIMMSLDCPILFWSPPDPLGTPFPKLGSLVGAIQNIGVLIKMGKKVKIILEDINDEVGFNKLKDNIDACRAIKKLRFSSVGLIGSRTPGMLDTTFHELTLRKQIGTEVVHIELAELLSKIKKVSDQESHTLVNEIVNNPNAHKVDQELINESIKIYLATKSYIKEYNLDGIAFKCWPDLMNNDICTPCYTLSKLSDEGYMSACEADVTAVVTMLMLFFLTDNNVFLGDLLKINKKTNEAMYFHCGAMSSRLATSEKEIEYRKHSDANGVWKVGLTVEFPLKPGRVTFCRIGEIEGQYRMITYSGNAIETDMFVRGNPSRIILDKNPEQIVNGLIKNASEHHQIAVHGDITNKLKIISDYLELEYAEL